MKERKIEIEYQFAQLEELSQEEQNLVEKAIAATQNSYANYSHFYVGASCLLEDGSIVIGANQENAAFHQDSVLKEQQSLQHRQTIRNCPSRPLPSLQEMPTDFSRIRFPHVELAVRSSSK